MADALSCGAGKGDLTRVFGNDGFRKVSMSTATERRILPCCDIPAPVLALVGILLSSMVTGADPATDDEAEFDLLGPRGSLIEKRLELNQLDSIPVQDLVLSIDEAALERLFPGLDALPHEVRGDTASVVMQRDGAFVGVLDVELVKPPERMADAVAMQFALISGPLTGLRRVDLPGLDLMAVLSERDGFAVAVRGSLLATARTTNGLAASELASAGLMRALKP